MARKTSSSPARDSHTLAARERILVAAADLIERTGADTFSVKDLCAEVGVTQSLVNYHFSGRGGLISSVIIRAIDDLRAQLPDGSVPTDSSNTQSLRESLGRSIAWAQRHPSLFAAMVLRFTDNFATDVRPEITADLQRAWRELEATCAAIARPDGDSSGGLHLLWVLFGSMAWLTFPSLGRDVQDHARSKLPMSSDDLVRVLTFAFEPKSGDGDEHRPLERHRRRQVVRRDKSARESLIVAAVNLLTSLDGRTISARTVCSDANCAPSLVTYHFGTFDTLVAEAATRVFIDGANDAERIARSGEYGDASIDEWLWTVVEATSGAIALPIALGSTHHRRKLADDCSDRLESTLRDAWLMVIGSTAHLARRLLKMSDHQWTGRLDDFTPTPELLSTMSFIGLTGLGASLWTCSTSTYRGIDETRSRLSCTVPAVATSIAAVAESLRR